MITNDDDNSSQENQSDKHSSSTIVSPVCSEYGTLTQPSLVGALPSILQHDESTQEIPQEIAIDKVSPEEQQEQDSDESESEEQQSDIAASQH